jgi:hypothetical protein
LLGTSLISLLISLSLGLFILEAVMSWHQVLKRSFVAAKLKREDLEIGRTVFQFMSNDIKFSGYRGLRTLDENFPIKANFVPHKIPFRFYQYHIPVFGFRSVGRHCLEYLPLKSCKRIKENTDVIIVYNIPNQIDSLQYSMQTPLDVLETHSTKKRHQNAMFIISDAQSADLFVATEIEPGRIFHAGAVEGNLSNALSKAYQAGAEVIELETVMYYLGVSERSTKEKPLIVLFRDNLFQKAEELTEGIEELIIEYQIHEPTMGMQYRRAEEMSDTLWPWVEGVRVTVLTEREGRWDYEFSIRNRHCFSSSAYFFNRYVFRRCTSHDARGVQSEIIGRFARSMA